MSEFSSGFYVTGGNLRSDTPSYVERRADQDLYEALKDGEFCYVLTSRQMGKSSLMVRTAARLRQEGVHVANLDFTALGQNLAPEQWYYGMLGILGERLDLEDELDAFWLDHASLGPLRRFMAALRQIVLPRSAGRVVIFIDEIDVVRSLPFSTDEFFAAIREFYNGRTEDADLCRLTFCLMGVAAPTDLIRDTRMTPFNIGRRIELSDFTPDEAARLAQGLTGRVEGAPERLAKQRRSLLERILHWTGGHPYLTQRLCLSVAEHAEQSFVSSPTPHTPHPTPYTLLPTPSDVDRLCEELFLSHAALERDNNLIFVRERILRSEAELAAVLEFYRDVLAGKLVPDDDTNPLIDVLRLSGIARVRDGRLQVRNRIYERVFDRRWVRAHMPDAEMQRQKAAYRRGLRRAAAFGTAVVATMAVLALTAVSNANQARDAKRLADTRAAQANSLAGSLKTSNAALQLALADARSQQNRANNEAGHARVSEQKERVQSQAAQTASTLAESRRVVAEKRTEESNQRLVRLDVANGNRLSDEGDPYAAALWFAEARRLEKPGASRDEMQRYRIAAALQRCPKLAQCWFPGGQVYGAEFSPDGRRVVTACFDGTARVWDAVTGKPLTPPMPHPYPVKGAHFSPDGRRVVTACGERHGHGEARVWDSATGRPVTPPIKSGSYVSCAAFSPDGRYILTGSYDKTARVWNAATGKPVAPPLQNIGIVDRIMFSPDGRSIVTASYVDTRLNSRGEIVVWDNLSGKRLFSSSLAANLLTNAAFSPDGRRILATRQSSVQIWEMATGRSVASESYPLQFGWIMDAEFSPDSRFYVTASQNGDARVWDAATGKAITPVMKHRDWVNSAAFSRDGRFVATASNDRTARVWDASTGRPVSPPLQHGSGVLSVEFSPDGRYLLTASLDGTARMWDLAAGLPDVRIMHDDSAAQFAAFSPDGRRMVTAGINPQVWDGVTCAHIASPSRVGKQGVGFAAFSRDGKRIVTASASLWFESGILRSDPYGEARVFDADTGKPLTAPMKHSGGVNSAVFSPDGRFIVTTSWDKTARLWDATGRPLPAILRHEDRVEYAEFSPNSRLVVTASLDGTARVWEAATGREIVRIRPGGPVSYATFSPDGRRVATATAAASDWSQFDPGYGRAGSARIWDAFTGKPLTVAMTHSLGVLRVEFSPDGRRVATASRDNTARVWDARTGLPVTPSLQHDGNVRRATFSFDGRLLLTATGGRDNLSVGEARVWDARTGEPLTPRLTHNTGVTDAAFSPDARRVVTTGGDETKLWTLPRDDRPLKELAHTAQLLSGRKIDRAGGLIPLAPAEYRTVCLEARNSHPGDSTASPAQIAAWTRANADEFRRSADRALAARQYDRAIRLYTQAINVDSVQAQWTLPGRANAYIETGQLDRAIFDLTKANELRPANAWNWFALGETYYKLGQWGRAIQPYSRALEFGSLPDWAINAASDKRIEAYIKLGKGEEALVDLTKRIQSKPQDPSDWYNRAKAYGELGRWDEAEADWSKAFALDPNSAESRIRVGDMHSGHGRRAQAITFYSKAIELDPNKVWAYLNRGACYLALGQADKAIADHTKAIELNPDEYHTWYYRGYAYAANQQWDRAIKDYAKAVEVDPNSYTLWIELAYARAGQGDLAACRKTCEEMLAEFARLTNPFDVNNACWAAVIVPNAVADYAEPIRRMQKAGIDAPKEFHVTRTLGCVLFRAGRFDDAIKHLNESIAMQNGNGGAIEFLFLAMAHQQLGHGTEARQWLTRATTWISANSEPAAGSGVSWTERLMLQVFRREAEAMIHPSNR